MGKFIIAAVIAAVLVLIIIGMAIFYRLLIGKIKLEISGMLLEDFKFWADEICNDVSSNLKRMEKRIADERKNN